MEVVWVIDLLPLRSKYTPKYLPRDQQENSFNHLSFKVSMVLTFLGREQLQEEEVSGSCWQGLGVSLVHERTSSGACPRHPSATLQHFMITFAWPSRYGNQSPCTATQSYMWSRESHTK